MFSVFWKLYPEFPLINCPFSEADDGDGDDVGDVKEDDNVVVYGVVPDMYSKLCNSMQSLFSCRSSSPTTNTFEPNFFDRKGFFC